MGQVSPFLRKSEDGYTHWCPGCEEPHSIRTTARPGQPHPCWTFNGDLIKPHFDPSIRITSGHYMDGHDKAKGCWCTYNAKLVAEGKADDVCFECSVCHYHLHAGVIIFCPDSTHALRGMKVHLPSLPPHMRDRAL